MEISTIKLEVSLINKIKEIQALNGYKSVNETVKHILPQGTVTPETVTYEQPAFTLNDKETYIIVDKVGDVYLHYFHFL